MNPSILTTQLELARDQGHRVALGFQHRLMMLERIHDLKVTGLTHAGAGAGVESGAVYEVVGMLYDTAHSRNATHERVFFESTEVVYLARPESLPVGKGSASQGPASGATS